MCVNKTKLKTAHKKQPFELNTFLKLHTMTMGQHFWQFWGYLLLINVVRNDY